MVINKSKKIWEISCWFLVLDGGGTAISKDHYYLYQLHGRFDRDDPKPHGPQGRSKMRLLDWIHAWPLDLVKSNIPVRHSLQKKGCQKINKIVNFWQSNPHQKTRIGHFGARVDGNINLSNFFDELRLERSMRPLRLLRLLTSLRLLRFLMPGKSLSM